MRTILTDRLREKRTRGGRGSKKPENLRTYLMDAPLLIGLILHTLLTSVNLLLRSNIGIKANPEER